MDKKERKTEIRALMLAKRDSLPREEKAILDEYICNKIAEVISTRQTRVIHTFLPFGSEIDIYPLIQSLLDTNHTVICARTLPKRALENLVLHSLAKLEEGRFGTMHPKNSEVYTGEIDLFIVPGIAFDKENHRIGFGAGYYDTFFASHPRGYKVGIAYPFQIIDDFPLEAHDVPLDAVIY